MRIETQTSLLPYNTFSIDARVDELVILESTADLDRISDKLRQGLLIGGGSNILLSKPRYPLAVINRIQGISTEQETEETIVLSVGAGENWHELVMWSLSNDYGGLENLSLIPGTVGAGPIQNIGAYGVEIKDVLVGVDFYGYEKNRMEYIPASQCELRYRDSKFKNDLKNKGLITRVYLKLTKKDHHIHSKYKALQYFLAEQNNDEPTIHEISEAVIKIRQSKLPDWKETGNAGSFFKNPVLSYTRLVQLTADYPEIPSFEVDDQTVKIPAAWLIQEAGFKGIRRGQVGTYPFQPLVLVNYGGGTAKDLLQLKEDIQSEVWKRFRIALEPEVTIL